LLFILFYILLHLFYYILLYFVLPYSINYVLLYFIVILLFAKMASTYVENISFLFACGYRCRELLNILHAWLYEWCVRAIKKQSKLNSDGGDSGSKKFKRGYCGAYGRFSGDGMWQEPGVRQSVLCWCVLQESGFSHIVYFSTLTEFVKKFKKSYTFDAIYKDNAAVKTVGYYSSTQKG
jgi:hypothetical protein